MRQELWCFSSHEAAWAFPIWTVLDLHPLFDAHAADEHCELRNSIYMLVPVAILGAEKKGDLQGAVCGA